MKKAPQGDLWGFFCVVSDRTRPRYSRTVQAGQFEPFFEISRRERDYGNKSGLIDGLMTKRPAKRLFSQEFSIFDLSSMRGKWCSLEPFALDCVST